MRWFHGKLFQLFDHWFHGKLIQLFDQYLRQINAKYKFRKNTLVSRNFYLVTGWYWNLVLVFFLGQKPLSYSLLHTYVYKKVFWYSVSTLETTIFWQISQIFRSTYLCSRFTLDFETLMGVLGDVYCPP